MLQPSVTEPGDPARLEMRGLVLVRVGEETGGEGRGSAGSEERRVWGSECRTLTVRPPAVRDPVCQSAGRGQIKRQRRRKLIMMSGGGGDANGKHDGHDKLLFILRQSFVLVCYIATALASQPNYIPLTFTALQRYDTLCHYTHNEPMVPGN